jgi:7-cyano-7-deazaguanine synthase
MGFNIPITYVPLRNTIFLALSAAYLESQVLYAIEEEGAQPGQVTARVFMAPNAIDYSGYPDCRPEYYEKMRQALQYGSKMWTQYQIPIQVETPIIHLSKAKIVRLGVELRAPLEHTWSCYQGGSMPCGRCNSCILRAKGFQEAGFPDPLLVRLREVRECSR